MIDTRNTIRNRYIVSLEGIISRKYSVIDFKLFLVLFVALVFVILPI